MKRINLAFIITFLVFTWGILDVKAFSSDNYKYRNLCGAYELDI